MITEPNFRTSSTTTRDRNLQFRGAVSTGGSPLDFLLFFSSIYVQFSKTSPLKSGESSEKSSGENRVKSCHVCGCHGFFGPENSTIIFELILVIPVLRLPNRIVSGFTRSRKSLRAVDYRVPCSTLPKYFLFNYRRGIPELNLF